MATTWRFLFTPPWSPGELEADLRLAVFAAECVHGGTALELEAGYFTEADGRAAVIRSFGPAGDALARIFTGLLATRLGETGFRVEPIMDATATRTTTSRLEPAAAR
jgi:hypothetical protein